VFQLNKDYCALGISDILEITSLDTMVKSQKTEINVILWGQRSIPVLDPFAMLTLHDHKPTVKSRIAIVERDGKIFGVLFDSVLGTVDIDMDEVVEPMLNEPRYVSGVCDEKVKIFKPEALLTKKTLEKFESVYQLDMEQLEVGIKNHENDYEGQDEILEDVRLRSLNWLIKATRGEIEESYIDEILLIHDKISRL
jgi:chemotaxis signal transduction protein